MRRTLLYLATAVGFLALFGAFAAPAYSHESRVFGNGFYVVVVGWHEEPAFEDEGNGLDLFISYDTTGDGECHVHEEGEEHDEPDCIPLDASAGDVVDISARVLYLRDDEFDAQILASEELEGDLVQDFFDPSRYTFFLKPNVEGAYGFKISGTLHKVDQAQPAVELDQEKFVCGNGTQGDEAFDCVDDILQPFPRPAFSNYRNDTPLHLLFP
jgi:hypothetical protein